MRGNAHFRSKRGGRTLVVLAVGCVLAVVGSQVVPALSRLRLAVDFNRAGGAAAPALADNGAAAVQAARLDNLTEAVDAFKTFVGNHQRELEQLWRGRLERLPERGVVVAAGSPKTLANTFVSLHVLRNTLGCQLPVTVM